MKKQPKTYIFYLGIAIFAVGILLKCLFPDADGPMLTFPFVMTGFGSGIIGVGVAGILRKKSIDKNPEKAREYEIAEKDERNIRVREKSGYATWFITLFVLAILSLASVVMINYFAFWLTFGALCIHVISLYVLIYLNNKKI